MAERPKWMPEYMTPDEVQAMVDEVRARTGYRIIGPGFQFNLGDRVTKIKGSSWTGHVVGFYSTALTPVGYDIESENEPGSVQIYPQAAIRSLEKEGDDNG